MSISILFVAPLIGLLISLFAAGGGMIAVPMLSYGMDMPFKQAVASSLILLACVSLISLLQQRRWTQIDWHLHRYFATGGLIGGISGALLGLRLPDQVQALLFAVLVLLVAWWMNSKTIRSINSEARERPCRCGYAVVAGIGSGLVTGLLGIGGGMVIVPMLLMLGVKTYHSAIAHSLLLITTNSLIAALGYANSVDFAWVPILVILSVAAIGSWLGSFIAMRYSSQQLQHVFSLLLIILSVWTLFRIFF